MVFSSILYPKQRYNMQIQNVMPGFKEEIVLTTYKFMRGRKQFRVNIYTLLSSLFVFVWKRQQRRQMVTVCISNL